MKQPTIFSSALLTTLGLVSLAQAASYYGSPSGSGSTCSESSPCSASSAVGKGAAGDTVYLKGGTYSSGLNVSASGSASAWLTIAAAPGELPIINSGGINIQGTYVRFDGIVSRNASTGFGNKWTGGGTTNSNGHLEFLNCIADFNTANGIAFRSATGVHISQCITAHNGSSTSQSWSSGVDLFGAQGTYQDNIIERTVSFENVDNQQHTDGSGFIVDDIGTGATFVNNIGFRNGGSCIRLTTSTNTHIINNSCYHDGLDQAAQGPPNPGEIFFSSSQTQQGAVMLNNLAAAAGWNNTQKAYNNNGNVAISPYNIGVDSNGATPFFADPAGQNPDFRLTSGSTAEIDKGSTTEAPSVDIGFDPKCITKAAPVGSPSLSWWIYAIDYDYITSIGGVAKCFNPMTRTGVPDIGAYEQNGTLTAPTGGSGSTTGGAAPTDPTGGTSAVAVAGGTKATGGAGPTTGGYGPLTGGSKATGGAGPTTGGIGPQTGGSKATGGAGPTTGGAASAGGAGPTTGGAAPAGGAGPTTGGAEPAGGASNTGVPGNGGSPAVGGVSNAAAGTSTAAPVNTSVGNAVDTGACGCRVQGKRTHFDALAGLGLLGALTGIVARRRRRIRGTRTV
jgi:hypothetical protein